MSRHVTSRMHMWHDKSIGTLPESRFFIPNSRHAILLILLAALLLSLAVAGYTARSGATTFLLILAVIPCVAGIGNIYQTVAAALDRRWYPPPGRLVDVNGHRLHLLSAGTEGPAVVLEAGLGAMCSGWGWIQPEVARFARVVSYDRAGLGWSAPCSAFPSASHAACQLYDLLQASGIEGPYVLVGHSMGGLLVRVFADRYPDAVAGMVLVDASHPDQYERSPAIRRHMNAGFQLLKRIPLLTRLGYVRLTRFLHSQAEGLPARQRREAEVFLSSYGHLRTTLNESLAWDSVCAEVRSVRPLGGRPLAVVSAGKDLLPGAAEFQGELAALSSESTHHVVEGATHVTLVTHREHAVSVIDAIRHVVGKVRNMPHRGDKPAPPERGGGHLAGGSGGDPFRQVLAGVSVERMSGHIRAIEGIRHPQVAPEALERTAGYIRDSLQSLGYEMAEHRFADEGREFGNIIATKRGTSCPEELVIVLAHYDTVPTTPGADDNASGVAALLELAAILAPFRFERSVAFIGVNLEENAREGDHASGLRGSRALAAYAREQGWAIEGVVVLESIAYAGDDVIQTAPAGIPIDVPEVGNFIAVVGNEASVRLVEGFARSVERYRLPLPYLSMVVPGAGELLPDTRRSDHASFWDAGYKAIMLTDTTNFRSPHYHRPSDTLETLNLEFAANVCRATAGMVLEAARRQG